MLLKNRIYFSTLIICMLIIFSFCGYLYYLIPTRKDLTGCMVTKMYSVSLCPGSGNYVPLNQISKYIQKTVIITEDSLFYQHNGFDWESIEKSAKENLKKGKFKRGGSTITQQLAKNLYLSKDKSLFRKALEAFLTVQIERNLTKREILEKYLNVVEFGKNIYGVKSAAKYYFGKTPAQLDVLESAFLAMLLPSPIKYASSFHKKKLSQFAHSRLRRIISDLYEYDRINENEYLVAKSRLSTFLSNEYADDNSQDVESDEDETAESTSEYAEPNDADE